MNRFFRPPSLPWLALTVGATLFVLWGTSQRVAEFERVSELAPGMPPDDVSPTGYFRGTRNLILPERTPSGLPWIMDAQAAQASDTPLTRVEYDNAPEGRPIHGASAYRAWIRFLATVQGSWQDLPARAIERAALHANPMLQVLLCLGAGLFVMARFGPATGGLVSLGIAVLFPITAVFAPGQPDDHALFLSANVGAMLLLVAGTRATLGRARRIQFVLGGACAGLGLWLDGGTQLIALTAVWFGGMLAAWFVPRDTPGSTPSMPLPWRWWAAGGAIVALAGWLVEGRPGGALGVTIDVNHPLLVAAWLAGAEALVRLTKWRQEAGRRDLFGLVIATAILVLVTAWLLYHGGRPMSFGPAGSALANYTGAESIAGWIRSDGLGLPLVASALPLLLVALALRQLVKTDQAGRRNLLVVTGAAIFLIVLCVVQVRWWGILDAVLLGLLPVVVTGLPVGFAQLAWRSAVALLFLPAFVLSWPRTQVAEELTPTQARALIERDLAHWLSARSEPGAITLAPPALSGSLAYYGGLPVIASPFAGNQDGLTLAVRIAATTSADEAQALLMRRGVQYVVVPSWDTVLDELARLGPDASDRSLIALLRQWLPPRWLRPVPYQMPMINGLAGDSVAVFEVVEPQENAIALSRLAEYFVETGRLDLAVAVSDSLEQAFANDAGAMIARAQVAIARGESRTLARVVPLLLPAVADGKDEDLSWERRANLAIVLAQVKRPDLARPQVEFCLEEADAERLRSLGTISLYRLLALARGYGLAFADPTLHAVALGLLPPEFRQQLPQ